MGVDGGFTAADFKNFHPGGALGTALTTVGDLMHSDMPLVDEGVDMSAAIKNLSEKSFGCVGITKGGALIGIITDGDLRRNYSTDLSKTGLTELMTKGPKTAIASELAADALRRMTAAKISQLFVIEGGQPVGIVHLHDFLKAGIA